MARAGFFHELHRRHVIRVGLAYAATSWLLLQLGAIIFPTLHAPRWCEAVLLAFLVLGLPVALLLAWAFEVTPEGMRRTVPAESAAGRPAAQRRRAGRLIDFVIIAVLAAAVSVLTWRLIGSTPKSKTARIAATPASSPAPHTVIPAKSLAVLPFANDSGDPNQRYFSDGLSESLIVALSHYPALTVIGRESSFQLRNTTLDSEQIGEKLGVATLLEGSVSHAGDEVRVRAELVSTANGRTLWSAQYDRPYKNLFALQDDITKAVATALRAKLLGSGDTGGIHTDRPPSGSLEAYNAYLEGDFYFNRFTEKSFRTAIGYYRKAVALDPSYATAYAALSYAWTKLGAAFLVSAAQRHAYAMAKTAAGEALRLDPDSAEAHRVRGYLYLVRLRWKRGLAELRRALQLAPDDVRVQSDMATVLAIDGRVQAAIRTVRKALNANPLNAQDFYHLSLFYDAAGRSDAAEHAIREAIALQPSGFALYEQLAVVEIKRGDAAAALAAAKRTHDPAIRSMSLALAYAALGDHARADAALHDLATKHSLRMSFQVAEIYAFRGQADKAFAWLERAWRAHDPGISYLLYDPFLSRYRSDPRFAAFCRKVGLPTPAEVEQTSLPNPETGT